MVKVSVIIPTRNEAQSIGMVLDEIPKDFAELEIIVIDTDSRDETREIARSKGAKVIEEPRRGYGRAYKTGFKHATGEIIVTLDGDGTYPACDIPKLVNLLRTEKLDFISCDRLTRLRPEVMSTAHLLGNKILSLFTRLLFRVKINDSQSGMWFFQKKILPHLTLTNDGMAFSEELKIEVCQKGFKFKEVPIDYRARRGEVKLQSWTDGRKNLLFLFKKALSK